MKVIKKFKSIFRNENRGIKYLLLFFLQMLTRNKVNKLAKIFFSINLSYLQIDFIRSRSFAN